MVKERQHQEARGKGSVACMAEKPIHERVAVNEEKLRDHGVRIGALENSNQERQNAIVRAMWWCIRLLIGVTALTLLTDKMREKWEFVLRLFGL